MGVNVAGERGRKFMTCSYDAKAYVWLDVQDATGKIEIMRMFTKET